MARTVNLGDDGRPPKGESAPSAKRPAAKRSAPRSEGGSGGRSSASAAAPSPKLTGDDAKLHASLVRLYSMIGIGMTGIGQAKGDLGLATAGVNVTTIASDTADAWIELAQGNPRVRSALNGLVAGSAAANLIGCHIGMIAPVLAARGAVPAGVGMMFMSDEAKGFYTTHAAAATAAA